MVTYATVRAWAVEADLWLGLAINGWVLLVAINFLVQQVMQRLALAGPAPPAEVLLNSLTRSLVQLVLGVLAGVAASVLVDWLGALFR